MSQNHQKSCHEKSSFLKLTFFQFDTPNRYPWQFGDPLNDSGMFRRCEADHGRGNCEKWGAVVYPKCKKKLLSVYFNCTRHSQ